MIFDGNAPTNPPKCVYVCTNHFTPDCFLNEGQFKAGFVKKLKLKDGSVPIVCDPAAPSEVVSLTLIFFYGSHITLQPKTGFPLKLSRVELVSTWMGDLLVKLGCCRKRC